MSTTHQAEDPRCRHCGAPLAAKAPVRVCLRCALGHALDPVQETATTASARAAAACAEMLLEASFPRHFGDYELLEEIARGGMGVVYRARQLSLNRIVALKMLLAGPLATKDFIQRFRTEAASAASLQHPNIVAIHEVGFIEGQHFFAMDYVEGLTLAQLANKGPLPAGHAATYLKTVAEAIHFAHERNVLHRDLKPSNVLIDSVTDQPRVTDFGLAKRLEAETELTLSGQVLGSPNYMSPEQAVAKRGTVSKRSDVYSLGAILYHLLTGRPPFQGETLTDVLHQLVNDDPLDPHLLTPRVPHDLETICLKCLEKEPERRYQTAHELAAELGRFLRHEPILARPITALEHTWRWAQRNPAIAGLSAATLLLLLLVAIGSPIAAFRIGRERDRAQRERDRADQNLYDSDMSFAQHTWDDGDLGGTLTLLEAHRPKAGEREDLRGFEWYYYWNLCQGDPHTVLSGHSNAVNCVSFSPDGKSVATGSPGSSVRIWDTASGRLVRHLPEQKVVSLAFAPDGRHLAVGGQDQVVVWNLETGQSIFKLAEALGQFRVAFSRVGTLLAIGKHAGHKRFGSDGGSTELWDYTTRELKHSFPESGGFIALSPRGDRLATGNSNQTVTVWDLATLQPMTRLKTVGIITMALSPDSQTLVTGDRNAEVNLWDVSSGRKIGSLTNNQQVVWSLAVSPDGRFLATGSEDQTVHLWDVATLRLNREFVGHRGEVISVDFSPNGQMVVSGSKDRTAMLWSIHSQRTVTTVSNVISRPIFSTDGRWVAASIKQGAVALWDVPTFQMRTAFAGARDAVAFSRDGLSLATRSTNEFLKSFDLSTFTARDIVSHGPVAETDDHAVLSPDGRTVAVGLANGTLSFFDSKTGVEQGTDPHAYASNIFQIAFSPNGKFLAATGREVEAGRNPAAKIFDGITHKMFQVLSGHTDTVLGLGFSPDGQLMATCGSDDTIRFWNTTTWKEIPPSLGQKETVNSLCFSPDGRTLASASMNAIKLWDLATRHEVGSLKPGLTVAYINFSPDGQTLVAYGWDGLLRLWRAPVPAKNQPQSRDD